MLNKKFIILTVLISLLAISAVSASDNTTNDTLAMDSTNNAIATTPNTFTDLNKLINDKKIEVKDLIPNPVLIKNVNSIEIITEKVLHNLILEDIESFMKELGNSFYFIGSEYNIKIGDTYHKIDLLLFNIKCNAYVVVELKVTEFKVEYISQVQKYMNYIDKNIKEINNNQTIGIIICKKENKFVIEYCSDDRISVREYELV